MSVFVTGGSTMELMTILMPRVFCCFVTVVVVIMHVTTFSRKIYKSYLMNWREKFVLPIILLTHQNITPDSHRLFPHITRACQGLIFQTIELVTEAMEKTKTSTGLKVFTSVVDQVFATGRKVADGFKENMKLKFDEFLPQWNYIACPS